MMGQETIQLSELPALTVDIKRAICLLVWSLYHIEDKEDPSAWYLLRTRKEKILLRKDGNIIRKITNDDNIEIKSIVFFEGFDFSFNGKLC